jgi:hypothetical protein
MTDDSDAARATRRRKPRYTRLIVRANHRHGGAAICHGCKRPLASGEITLFGYDHTGAGIVVAVKCCGGLLKIALGYGCWVAAQDAPASWLRGFKPWGRA